MPLSWTQACQTQLPLLLCTTAGNVNGCTGHSLRQRLGLPQ